LLCCSSGVFPKKINHSKLQFFIFINTINKYQQFIGKFSNFPSINIYNQRQLLTIEKIINARGHFIILTVGKFFSDRAWFLPTN
jgi:hypothetical protein